MNLLPRSKILFGGLFLLLLAVGVLLGTAPRNPMARPRVIDATGRPVAGAVIQPEGMRAKPPYVSGWYGWGNVEGKVPNPPVTTDQDGWATIPYPKFVFERIETGTLCLPVRHPAYVADRPERVVATAPPAGAPWRVWLDDLWNRVRHQTLVAQPDPIVLQKGATVRLSMGAGPSLASEGLLTATVSQTATVDRNFWEHPQPGILCSSRIGAGKRLARVSYLSPDGKVWFSEVLSFQAKAGETNDLKFNLRPGATLRGQLDASVPRPVKNGRVVANVWATEDEPKNDPPQWHGWAPVSAEGNFEVASLPPGKLEVLALCAGHISTNGPGQFNLRYPQLHTMETNDLAITIGMEPTTALLVEVKDEQGRPLKDATIMAWPNARYGEWAATVLMSDCYNTADWLKGRMDPNPGWRMVPDFKGVTDANGVAFLPNLPLSVGELNLEHEKYALPAVATTFGEKRRTAPCALVAVKTNRLALQVELKEQSLIRHY